MGEAPLDASAPKGGVDQGCRGTEGTKAPTQENAGRLTVPREAPGARRGGTRRKCPGTRPWETCSPWRERGARRGRGRCGQLPRDRTAPASGPRASEGQGGRSHPVGQEPSPATGPGAPRQPPAGPSLVPSPPVKLLLVLESPSTVTASPAAPRGSGSSPPLAPGTLGSHHSRPAPSLPPRDSKSAWGFADCTRESAPGAGERRAFASMGATAVRAPDPRAPAPVTQSHARLCFLRPCCGARTPSPGARRRLAVFLEGLRQPSPQPWDVWAEHAPLHACPPSL